ncbi:MAG TPA: fused MFS/spermidine synthase [Candidatus Binatia bacterium]|nr:fused MFS/spermidine synthase [Candidatus Binatia bacterium]
MTARAPGPTALATRAGWPLVACLFASGAAALIYEVVWLRQLGLVMGHTAYALSTVLTSFLGGLALGAYAGGRWARRGLASPRLYAAIELGVAVAALLMPLAIAALDPVFGGAYRRLADRFVAYNLVQFTLAGAVLLVPTFLMGTTLPIVTDMLVRSRARVGVATGLLYAVNSLGGCVGVALAGFVLLPRLGMAATNCTAAALNVVAAAVALASARRLARPDDVSPYDGDVASERDDAAQGWPAPSGAALALFYGVSGFAALTLEVAWARVVGLSIGSTMHGFTITLVSYIFGIALGSFAVPRVRFFARDPVRGLFALQILISLWTLVTLRYLGDLPARVLELLGSKDLTFERFLGGQLVLVLLTFVVPTVAMGGMFPLVAQLLRRRVRSSGWATGLGYASNTVGNIAGSWVAGFVLIPTIGMRATVVLAALLSGLAGVLYLAAGLRERPAATIARALAALTAVLVAARWAPGWSRQLLTAAPYIFAQEVARTGSDRVLETIAARDLVEYREGPTGVVAVQRGGDALMLYQDGLDEAGTHTHVVRLLGHLPFLFRPDAKDVLVVGLGAGQTLRGVLMHPVDRVESIEISRDVRDVAEKYFARDVLADPRARVLIGDARNHLRYAPERWDAIVSQPSYPWLSGASNLFTREYFADVRAHLKPGGVAASWFFTLDPGARRSIIRAWGEVFPRSYVLKIMGQPRALIGLSDDRPLDDAAIAAALAHPGAARDLQAFGLKTPADVRSLIVASDADLVRDTSDVPASTDDNAYVAFHALHGVVGSGKAP